MRRTPIPALILALLAVPLATPAAAMGLPTLPTLLPTMEFPDAPPRLPRQRGLRGS